MKNWWLILGEGNWVFYPCISWVWQNNLSWHLQRLTRSLAKRSLSISFLSKESVTHRDIMEG